MSPVLRKIEALRSLKWLISQLRFDDSRHSIASGLTLDVCYEIPAAALRYHPHWLDKAIDRFATRAAIVLELEPDATPDGLLNDRQRAGGLLGSAPAGKINVDSLSRVLGIGSAGSGKRGQQLYGRGV